MAEVNETEIDRNLLAVLGPKLLNFTHRASPSIYHPMGWYLGDSEDDDKGSFENLSATPSRAPLPRVLRARKGRKAVGTNIPAGGHFGRLQTIPILRRTWSRPQTPRSYGRNGSRDRSQSSQKSRTTSLSASPARSLADGGVDRLGGWSSAATPFVCHRPRPERARWLQAKKRFGRPEPSGTRYRARQTPSDRCCATQLVLAICDAAH